MTVLQGAGHDSPERAEAYDDVAAVTGSPAADLATGLVNLKFIGTALRRRARLWSTIAAAGLLTGLGLYVALPPAYQASTTILLTQMPGGDTGPLPILKSPNAMQDNVVMLQSRTVAERAMRDLGLRQPVQSFIAAETVTPLTDRTLTLTVSAPSNGEAVSRANTLAAEFLKYRAQQLQVQQNLQFSAFREQISQAQQRVDSLSSQIASVSAQPASPARQGALKQLRTKRHQAVSTLTGLQQDIPNYQVTRTAAVEASGVLDPAAPVARAPGPLGKGVRIPVRYAVTGLLPGLVLGMGLAMVLELASDRLRRREDVARALGAPVRLSVVSVPARRGRPWRSAARGADLQRIAGHLRDSVPESPRGAAALAVVAVDNAPAAALPLVSLAVSCAQQGRQVIVADLSGGHAARLLGAGDPGVTTVTADGAQLVVAVPGRGEAAPAGPAYHGSPPGGPEPGGEALAAAYAAADYLFTLATLDPALGAEHLATWAADVVVTVTAGESSWEKLHSVGEMIRLAGTRLVSAVLLGADRTDESLGVTPAPNPPATALVPADHPDETLIWTNRATHDLDATQVIKRHAPPPRPRRHPDHQAPRPGRPRPRRHPDHRAPRPGRPRPRRHPDHRPQDLGIAADSPVPAHHLSTSRPSRGLRPGSTGERAP